MKNNFFVVQQLLLWRPWAAFWFAVFLNLEEVIAVIKEFFEKCTSLDGYYFALMPADYATTLSKGYQIHIKTTLDEKTRTCMQDILKKNHFTSKVTEPDTYVIYRPTLPEEHFEK